MNATASSLTDDGMPARFPPGGLEAALVAFRQAYPTYDSTNSLDKLRAAEYARLDAGGHIYLDYTGSGLYAERQPREHAELLCREVLGNPHSDNPTSLRSTNLVHSARRSVLEFFNAAPDEYEAVFTANASGALKLVGESYPFAPHAQLLLVGDNHNSVHGIREFARVRGAPYSYVSMEPDGLRIDKALLLEALDREAEAGPGLFAYPAQSNFTGVQHSLEWIATAQARGWDVLLDAAAFVPTNRLDLGRWHPDFVPVSFYKIFGYPTGVGCLLARKAALAKLRRPWFAGGTIRAVTVQGDAYHSAGGAEAFEDGTLNFLGLPAVEAGLQHIAAVGLDTIHTRVTCLAGWLLDNLTALRHRNGEPLARVYGPTNTQMRGATIAFNFLDPRGHLVDERAVQLAGAERNISLRTGCFCNPGAGEVALGLSKDALVDAFNRVPRLSPDELMTAIGAESGGAVRVSLGIVSNFADVYRLMHFAESFLDTFPDCSRLPPRHGC